MAERRIASSRSWTQNDEFVAAIQIIRLKNEQLIKMAGGIFAASRR